MLFSEVIGQESAKEQLLLSAVSGKISHAQLFLGKAGFGGLPLALAYIQFIFCENKQSNDSCGTCPSCRKVVALQHPDLHFSFPTTQAISKTSDGFIELWRERLTEKPYFSLNEWLNQMDVKGRRPIIGTQESVEIVKKLSLRSFEGGYKVMLIWMVEEMNTTCANKLLKIIEEPPEKTLFILIAEDEEKLLKTITSRTQKKRLSRLSIDSISEHLRAKHGVNPTKADVIATRSDGDILESYELLGGIGDKDENREQFVRLMRVCYKKNVLDMMTWAEEMAATSREYQKVFLKYALHMFRQSMLRNYTDEALTNASEEEMNFLEKFSRFITGNNIMDFMQEFNDAHYHIERNANPKMLFAHLSFQVMRYIHKA